MNDSEHYYLTALVKLAVAIKEKAVKTSLFTANIFMDFESAY